MEVKRKNNKKLLLGLIVIFAVLLSVTIFVSFSTLLDTEEVIVKSITPVYDESSTVVVDDENVVFNDKNQVVKYNVVLENTQDYDVKITDIVLTTPTEEFLQYTIEDIKKDDVLKANSTKELTISLETTGIKGWGRNFADELTANISFEKVVEEVVTPPAEDDKEEDKQPEAPATNIEEIINKSEKIEVEKITNNTIEFKEDIKVEVGDKVAVWIYSEPIFLGYFDVVEKDGIKQIVGLEEALKKAEINPGEHNIVLETEDKEVLGYVEIYISENKELLIDTPQDTTDKEETPKDENNNTEKPSVNKPSTNNKDDSSKEDEEEKIENPYTSDKGLLVVLVLATGVTGLAIIVVSKKKFTKYTILIIALSSTLTLVSAEDLIELPIKLNVSFNSQNVMSKAYVETEACKDSDHDGQDDYCYMVPDFNYFWGYNWRIQNIYIQNEKSEIKEYVYKFDVTEEQNGRVMAYLVEGNEEVCTYDYAMELDICENALTLYIQSDGVIYPNADSSYYFADMINLELINNLEGLDTSDVTDMSHMFDRAGYWSAEFTLDLSSFDTSNVTDMSAMFKSTGENSSYLALDLSGFNTSRVTDMSAMFMSTGVFGDELILDLSNFDTSNVTDMSSMFSWAGGFCSSVILDISNFDTSNVTDMGSMFAGTGISSGRISLDVSNFDTSKVRDMSFMFSETGSYGAILNTSITIKNPNVSEYTDIFYALAPDSRIIVNYTSKTEKLVDGMLATKSYATNAVKGVLVEDDNIYIGEEISIGSEKFNIIRDNGATVSMLAQYNIDENAYIQTQEQWYTFIFGENGWAYEPGPKEIDSVKYMSSYVFSAYLEFLQESLKDDTITGTYITLNELEALGCTVPSDYANGDGGWNCAYSIHSGWLVNGQDWWTKSAESTDETGVWIVYADGDVEPLYYDNNVGIRPVITIKKETLKYLESLKKYSMGEEISIGAEKFNVIRDNGATVSMLAQYNIDGEYRQNEEQMLYSFSDTDGWECEPGPKEIDIQSFDGETQTLLNNYVSYLNSEYNVDVTGDLITLKELEKLGCTIPHDYYHSEYEEYSCTDSIYKMWLNNSQKWWTRSADSRSSMSIWLIDGDKLSSSPFYGREYNGVRPVITISKEALEKLN